MNSLKLYESWLFLKNIDLVSETLEQDFTFFDCKTKQIYELKPGGKSININEKNKEEYVELSIKHVTEKGLMFQQLVLEEFHKVCDDIIIKPLIF